MRETLDLAREGHIGLAELRLNDAKLLLRLLSEAESDLEETPKAGPARGR